MSASSPLQPFQPLELYTVPPEEAATFEDTARSLKVNAVAQDALKQSPANIVGVKFGNQDKIVYYAKSDIRHIELESSHKGLKEIWAQCINQPLTNEKIVQFQSALHRFADKVNQEVPFELNSQQAEAKRLIEAINKKIDPAVPKERSSTPDSTTSSEFTLEVDDSLPEFPPSLSIEFDELVPSKPSPPKIAEFSVPLTISMPEAIHRLETEFVSGELFNVLEAKKEELEELLKLIKPSDTFPSLKKILAERRPQIETDLKAIPELRKLDLIFEEQALLFNIEQLSKDFLNQFPG